MVRTLSAILTGKLIFFLTRFLKLGGGYAAPGLYALKIDPDLISKLTPQIPNNIIITGTNGKTTTSRLLSHILSKKGVRILRNSTGSNLERGIASTLISHSDLTGKIRNIDIAVWEVDEAAFNKILPKIKPSTVVFLNAFRDQLDRYGEVDTVVKNWWDSLTNVDWKMQIITNAGDINTAYLGDVSKYNSNLHTLQYLVQDHLMYREVSMFWEMKKDYKAEFIAKVKKQMGLSGTEFILTHGKGNIKVSLNLPGIYNIYNCLAAFSVYSHLGMPAADFPKYLNGFSPAFGRAERLTYRGKDLTLFLIKNPVGATQALETVLPVIKNGDTLLLALNDNFADGRDVSWIWDIQIEKYIVQKPKYKVFVSGTRAYDLTLRLKYAGFSDMEIEPDLRLAFDKALASSGKGLFILPTYTAMLELQKLLVKKGIKKEYWK